MSEPITREETYLAAIAGDGVDLPNPITREELYLAAAAGMAVELPNPITRKEQFLQRVVETGGTGGGGVTIRNQNKTITQNGQYKADSGYTGLGTVTVNVPQEEPVLQDKTATQNGQYTADSGFDGLGTVTVAVPEPVLQDKTVTENGTVTADSGYDGLGKVTVNVAASGGEDTLTARLNNTLTEFEWDGSTLPNYAFYKCTSLKKVSAQNVATVPASCFAECTGITEVYFPEATTLANSCFLNTRINKYTLPKVTKIEGNVICDWTATDVDFPLATTASAKNLSNAKRINFPLITALPYLTINGCSALMDLRVNSVKTVAGGGIKNCKSLTHLVLPSVETLQGSDPISACTALSALILPRQALAAWTNQPLIGGNGLPSTCKVYVPVNLLETYKSATNWSTIADMIHAIEENAEILQWLTDNGYEYGVTT